MTNINYDRTCIYDGITFFIRDPASINHILGNPAKYKMNKTIEIATENVLWKYSGRFKNFTIRAAFNSRENGLTIGGSLHKYKNETHNHDLFTWKEFLGVYNDLVNEFKFDPRLADIWSLEGGVNINLPETYRYKASDIPEKTLLLKGKAKKFSSNHYTKDSYGLEILKGECRYKMYDKGRQFRLQNEVLRNECSCKSRPLKKVGLRTFEDLRNIDSHTKYIRYLISSFETILIFQPEILSNPDLQESEKMFLYQFNTASAWNKIRKSSDYQYQKHRRQLDGLINRYCDINYRQEILKQMRLHLS